MKAQKRIIRILVNWVLVIYLTLGFVHWNLSALYAENIKEPCVAGAFYPSSPQELAGLIEGYLAEANPEEPGGQVFVLISPHAGYGYSGKVAGFGYKLIKGKPYRTVVILGTSHHFSFSGASVYPRGAFKTPLGNIQVDEEFSRKLLNQDPEITFISGAFKEEHSVEVQLPFLQKTLNDFKIVPVVIGDASLATCQKLASLLKEAIGTRKDVLLVVSTDMYHGYDYDEADEVDKLASGAIGNMDAEALYYGIREGKLQLCGGFGTVTALILAKALGYNKAILLKHTNSAEVTGNKKKGIWTVGYSSWVIDAPIGTSVTGEPFGAAQDASKDAEPVEAQSRTIDEPEGGENMLNKAQRKRLLEIARTAIETHLRSAKLPEITETDPGLTKAGGAFVTLSENGQLRGCIGNLVGSKPLYLTVQDMAVEAATGDPRFNPLKPAELKNIEIEISVLSPLEKIDDPGLIKLGLHGVLVRQGYRSGVFLPQVATETGWSKEEFMSNLCAQKAGLSANAWKDKATEIYIFTAEVFSEKSY